MLNFFQPRPGRFGTQNVIVQQTLATGTLAAGTLTFHLGGLPGKAIVSRVIASALTYPTAATSCVLTLVKRDSSAAGNVTLTTNLDVNGKTAETVQTGTLVSTLTDAQKLLDTGDTLKVSLVTTGAVSVQPVGLTVTVELQYLY